MSSKFNKGEFAQKRFFRCMPKELRMEVETEPINAYVIFPLHDTQEYCIKHNLARASCLHSCYESSGKGHAHTERNTCLTVCLPSYKLSSEILMTVQYFLMICRLRIHRLTILHYGLWAPEVIAVSWCKLKLCENLIACKPSPMQGFLSSLRTLNASKFQINKALQETAFLRLS